MTVLSLAVGDVVVTDAEPTLEKVVLGSKFIGRELNYQLSGEWPDMIDYRLHELNLVRRADEASIKIAHEHADEVNFMLGSSADEDDEDAE